MSNSQPHSNEPCKSVQSVHIYEEPVSGQISFVNMENEGYSNQPGSSYYPVDISHSSLMPTAAEFTPQEATNGAIRKKPQKDQKPNKYNRNFYSNSKKDGNNRTRYNHGYDSYGDKSKALQDTKQFLRNINDNDCVQNNFSYYGRESGSAKPSGSYESRNGNYYGRRDYNFENGYRNKDRNNFRDNQRYDSGNRGYRNKYGQYNFERNYNNQDKMQNRYYDKYDDYKNGEQGSNNNYFKNKQDRRRTNFPRNYKKDFSKPSKKFNAASQKERLEEMINTRTLECLVCCEKIKNSDKIWSCKQCFHILHLNCTKAWAESSKVENGWRCPACQNICNEIPEKYTCYCGKRVEPRPDPGIIAHGCGDMCLRKGRNCEHKCSILCHPGPCPDCSIMVSKPCGCGSTTQTVKCCSEVEVVCKSVCNKLLECGIHTCKEICHTGSCKPCQDFLRQECYCGQEGRKVPCTSEHKGSLLYSCGKVCDKLLSCKNHRCQKICHENSCDVCERDVSVIKTCPCGMSPIENERKSCLDPIPCCDKICGKKLMCGQPNLPHTCNEKCHEGKCPPCPLKTMVRCRCGHMGKELPCTELTSKADDARCDKKCTKKRLCGKHKCNQRCCIELEHICPLPCNRLLSCGLHRCERTCHSGRCASCLETSFEELYCECGASVLYPPVPCGTKPPACNKPCSRQRPCGHEPNHSCHIGPCPPCTILCKKWCYGKHEERSAIPCHQTNFSCGLPCGKSMPCGRHKCVKPCHEGPCPLPCKQPCQAPRDLCGHPCNKPCHEGVCPESSCKHSVQVSCLCGLQKGVRPCIECTEEFKNIEMARLRDKIAESTEATVDISDIIDKPKKPSVLKILECNEDCRVYERNRRLAIGLQIRNPDLSQKLTPRYNDNMRQWAKKDPHFCQKVHDKLTELVQLAKQSKQKSRSYSFESMNRAKRQFVHEYCEHFGVESAAYDMEPNRNIVATAIKDKSWLPSMSLMEVLNRENGYRKVPGPVLTKNTCSSDETVSLKLPGHSQRPLHPRETIDYFYDPPV